MTPGWTRYTPQVARMAFRTKLLFVLRNTEGKTWIGMPTEIADNKITLENGGDTETIYEQQGPFQFTTLEGPTVRQFRLAEPKLPLE